MIGQEQFQFIHFTSLLSGSNFCVIASCFYFILSQFPMCVNNVLCSYSLLFYSFSLVEPLVTNKSASIFMSSKVACMSMSVGIYQSSGNFLVATPLRNMILPPPTTITCIQVLRGGWSLMSAFLSMVESQWSQSIDLNINRLILTLIFKRQLNARFVYQNNSSGFFPKDHVPQSYGILILFTE